MVCTVVHFFLMGLKLLDIVFEKRHLCVSQNVAENCLMLFEVHICLHAYFDHVLPTLITVYAAKTH